jgi:hypothetical protein
MAVEVNVADRPRPDLSRADAIAAAEAQAIARATEAGADPATITVIEVEDMPLAYLPGNALRVRVRVVGEMVWRRIAGHHRRGTAPIVAVRLVDLLRRQQSLHVPRHHADHQQVGG